MERRTLRVIITLVIAMIADGMDLQVLALALPSFMKELKISPVLAGLLGTYTLIGMGAGGVVAGWAADRVGRVRVIGWSVLVFSLGTGIIGLCQNYWQIALMRTISGFGIGAVYSVGNVLAAEYVRTKIRSTVLSVLIAGWSTGYVIAAVITGFVISSWGWRPLFIIAAIPGIVCLVMLHGTVDPVSWSSARERARAGRKNEFASIWRDRTLRRTFLLWSITSIFLQFGFYGGSTWLPSYLVRELNVDFKNMGWYLASSYTMGILAKPVLGILADHFGRRRMWVITGLGISVVIPSIIMVATRSNVASLLLIYGGLYAGLYAINATYLTESFPTAVRGTAMSTSYNIGRIGSIISPVFIGWIAVHGSISAGIIICALAYLVATLLPGIFIRDTIYDPTQ